MIGVEYSEGLSKKVNSMLFEKHILCGSTNTTLRILPPLIIGRDDVDKFIAVLDEVTSQLAVSK